MPSCLVCRWFGVLMVCGSGVRLRWVGWAACWLFSSSVGWVWWSAVRFSRSVGVFGSEAYRFGVHGSVCGCHSVLISSIHLVYGFMD